MAFQSKRKEKKDKKRKDRFGGKNDRPGSVVSELGFFSFCLGEN